MGDNGSGKTAFLEALFMSGAPNPEIALRLRQWRGFDQAPLQGTQFSIEDAVFGELFHALDKRRNISISVEGSREHVRSLTITYRIKERWVEIRPNQKSRKRVDKNRPAPITFTWTGPDRVRRTFPINMTGDGKFVVPMLNESPVESSFFGSKDDDFSPKETEQRREAALKRMLNTPPIHRTSSTAKPKKKKGRPTKKQSAS